MSNFTTRETNSHRKTDRCAAGKRIFTAIALFITILASGNSVHAQTGFTPLFVGSSPHVMRSCVDPGVESVDPYLGVFDGTEFGDVFAGQINFVIHTMPAHGTLTGIDSIDYTGGIGFPIGFNYQPNAGYQGLDQFQILAYDTYGDTDIKTVYVVTGPPPTPITGPSYVCVSGTATLSDSVPYGIWSAADPTISVDNADSCWLSGVSAGMATLTYSTGCGSDVYATIVVTDTTGVITGATSLCPTTTITLTDTIPGGSWSSQTPGTATISPTGVVTGVAAGTTIISYANGCSAPVTWPLTVFPGSTISAIAGTTTICQGGTGTLTDPDAGGKWFSDNTGIATIDSITGIMSGVAGGTVIMTYKLTNICGTATTTTIITVNPYPTVAAITGTNTICPAATTTLNSATGGGTWTITNTTLASVSATGVVTGISPGTDTVNYAVTNACGTTTVSYIVTINPLPAAGYIYGVGGVCVSGAAVLTDAVSGGTWSSSNTGFATVVAGTVSGVSAGLVTISYSYTNSCGTNVATHAMRVSTDPVISTLVGNGTGGFSGDGGPSVSAELYSPANTARDNAGNLYIADGFNNRIRMVSANGIVSTIAGTGTAGFSGDGAAATAANISGPNGIAVDGLGNIYFADQVNQRVRKISTSGIINTIAGNGTAGYTADAVPATTSELNYPSGIACDAAGNVYIADYFNNRIRKVNTSGIISTVAGTGAAGYTGDGTAATGAKLNQPVGVALDASGNLLIADNQNHAVRTVNTSGIISTLAGTGTAGATGDGAAATAALLNLPSGVAADGAGNIYIADKGNNKVRKIMSGIMSTVAGNGTGAYTGDGNVATAAQLYAPTGVVTDAAGNLYITDNSNNVVRVVTPLCSCQGTPSAGTVTASVSTGCSTYTSALSLSGATLSPGITYQWQSSADDITFSNVSGATNLNYSATVSAPVYYRCIVTCTSSSSSATATPIYLNEGMPAVSAISGLTTVCQGATITLADTTTGGSWSASGAATVNATGVVTGTAGGTATISYSKTNACGTTSATYTVSVQPLPTAGTISGSSVICPSVVSAYSVTATGGTWSASGVISVDASGNVTPSSSGNGIITYSVSSGCGNASTTFPVTVSTLPAAGTISGPSTVCATTTITLTDGTTGGSWTSGNPVAASVSGGVVTGLSTGTSTISYAVSNSCATAYATYLVTVNPQPNPGAISGNNTVCAGTPDTLTDPASGGTWSSTNTVVATVASNGIVTTLANGTTTISYTVTNGCGTAAATMLLTVNPMPNAGSISGTAFVCPGQTTTLTDGATGGTWTSSTPLNATVSGGVVSGLSAGTTNISYTVTNSCGTAATGVVVTVNPLPVAGTINGVGAICPANTDTATSTEPGGVWSSTTTSVATIDADGIITPAGPGTSTISYTVTNSCGVAVATAEVTVNAAPDAGIITGSATVCHFATTTLSNTTAGGVWSSSATGTASVSGGIVSGVSVGAATISYTVTNFCGTATVTKTITVKPLPDTGMISGPSVICLGSSYIVIETVLGGVWSASNGSATIIDGTLNGNFHGIDTIYYTVTNACGSLSAQYSVTIDPYPGIISGASAVCEGTTITLAENVPGGSWSASNTNVSVTSGVVTGNTQGTSTVTYTVSTGCGPAFATYDLTVNPAPVAGTISGTSSMCEGTVLTLSDDQPDGIWSASNGFATVTDGVVTGLTAGADTISYSVTNGCGTASATQVVTVNPLPHAGIISGGTMLCTASPLTLSETVSGGVWSTITGNASVTDGIATGVTEGADTIRYIFTNSCGADTAIHAVSVLISPSAGTISGDTVVCQGQTITLSDPTTGGSWQLTNTMAVGTDNIITGINAGMDTVYYLMTNICGTDTARSYLTINPLPVAGTISGPNTVCAGSTILLANSAPGGTWGTGGVYDSVSGGVVYGISAGTDSVWYLVSNSCGSASAHMLITVNPLPDAGAISGPNTVCTGATITLTETVSTGSWSITNGNATIASNIVTGSTAGIDTVYYTVNNICGTAVVSQIITVNPTLPVLTLSGPTLVCTGATITLTADIPGGTWTAWNTTAQVDTNGIVTGDHAGTDTIIYHVTNVCSDLSTPWTVLVNQSPDPGTITGTDTLCKGTSVTLTDAAAGGTWSATNGNMTVSATGIVTAVNTGTDTVKYTVTNSCGTASATANMLAITTPVTSILGQSFVCVDKLDTLYSSPGGGIWASFDTTKATVTSNGIVLGKAPGNDTIYYAATNMCGTTVSKLPLYVYSAADCPTDVPGVAINRSIRIYPNPTEGLINVVIPAATGTVTLRVVDLMGKTVMSHTTIGNTTNQFDLSDLAKGTYLLTADGDDIEFRERIVVW